MVSDLETSPQIMSSPGLGHTTGIPDPGACVMYSIINVMYYLCACLRPPGPPAWPVPAADPTPQLRVVCYAGQVMMDRAGMFGGGYIVC